MSLNPLISIGNQISEVLRNKKNISSKDLRKNVVEILTKMGISDSQIKCDFSSDRQDYIDKLYVSLAMVIAAEPKVLICDDIFVNPDPISKINTLVLLKELKKEFNFTLIILTNDIRIAASVSDRIAIMYAGQIIEYGSKEEIIFNSQHPYT